MLLAIHVAAGGLAMVLGAVALLVKKGGTIHHRAAACCCVCCETSGCRHVSNSLA